MAYLVPEGTLRSEVARISRIIDLSSNLSAVVVDGVIPTAHPYSVSLLFAALFAHPHLHNSRAGQTSDFDRGYPGLIARIP